MTRREPHGATAAIPPALMREARELLGLTQTAMGHAWGVGKQEVYRKECGDRPYTRVQVLATIGALWVATWRDEHGLRGAYIDMADRLWREVSETLPQN